MYHITYLDKEPLNFYLIYFIHKQDYLRKAVVSRIFIYLDD